MRTAIPLRIYALVLLGGSMGAVLALWVLWAAGLVDTGGDKDPNGNPPGIDYAIFHTSGHILKTGDGPNLYEDREFLAALAITTGVDDLGPSALFVNPPIFAALFLPMADLPYRTGLVIWSGIGLVALASGLWLIGGRRSVPLVFAALLFYPVFVGFRLGQNSFVSLLLLAISFAMLRRGNYWLAGVALGMLVFKPQLALGTALWWTFDWRRFRYAWIGALATATSLMIAGWLLWPNATRAYFTGLPALVGFRDPEFLRGTFSPHAFFVLLMPGRDALAIGLAIAAAGGGILWFWSFWKDHRSDLDGLFSLSVILSLWVSARVVIYDWTLLLIPAIILAKHRKDLQDTWLMLGGLVALAAVSSIPLTGTQLDSRGWAVQLAVLALALGAIGVSRTIATSR